MTESAEAFLRRTRELLPEGSDFGALEGYPDYRTALVLAQSERRQDAIMYFDKAISYGDYPPYYFNRSHNFYLAGMPDRGLEDLNRYLERWPQSANVLAERARRHAEAGRYDKAFADWEHSLKLDPFKPRALRIRAHYHARLGRFQEALADFNRALLHFGAFHAEVYYDRAMLHFFQLGDRKAAQADLVRATELNPNKPKYWYGYAMAFSKGPRLAILDFGPRMSRHLTHRALMDWLSKRY